MAEQGQQSLAGLQSSAEETRGGLVSDIASKRTALQNMLRGGTGEGFESDLSQRGMEDISGDIAARLKAAQSRESELQAIQDAFSAGKTLTSDQASNLGLVGGQRLYGVDITNPEYLSAGRGGAISEADIAQNPELARYQALAQLAGGQASGTLLGIDPVEGREMYDPNSRINKDKLLADIQSRGQEYSSMQQGALGKISPIIDMYKDELKSIGNNPRRQGRIDYLKDAINQFGRIKTDPTNTSKFFDTLKRDAGSFSSSASKDQYKNLLSGISEFNESVDKYNPDDRFQVSDAVSNTFMNKSKGYAGK
jgi:hypothetical protein